MDDITERRRYFPPRTRVQAAAQTHLSPRTFPANFSSQRLMEREIARLVDE
jgi:hypothetical protein